MKLLYAALAAVVLALASGTALARNNGGSGGHTGSFAAHSGGGHVSGGHMSGGHFGGSGPGFSGGQFARGNAGGHFGVSGRGFSGGQFARGNGGGHFVDHGFHHGFHAGPRFGVIVGGPLFVDPYYYAPAYAPAPAFYCASAGGYYPDVPYCPEGWQRVYPY